MRLMPVLLLLTGCSDVENPDGDNESEVITTVVLTFTPQGGGTDLVFEWTDPEDDGSPEIDPISVPNGTDYDVSVAFFDALQDPVEDITPEVLDEGTEHQVFITGTAMLGPATPENANALFAHSYADTDADGLPLGLENTFETLAAGSGEVIVTLRHLPPQDGTATKIEDLAQDVAQGGFGSIGGDTDAQVIFPATVTP